MKEKILQLDTEKTIFWSLLGVFILSALFYMYAINATIHNVVAREKAENTIAELTLDIGTKEFNYIAMRNAVTLSFAYSLGFKDTAVKTFISKQSPSYISYLSNER